MGLIQLIPSLICERGAILKCFDFQLHQKKKREMHLSYNNKNNTKVHLGKVLHLPTSLSLTFLQSKQMGLILPGLSLAHIYTQAFTHTGRDLSSFAFAKAEPSYSHYNATLFVA